MGKKPKLEDSTQRAAPGRVVPKRPLSRWERERRRRRIVAVVVVVVIVAVLGLIGYGYYDARIKPWHQPIVKINDKVYDMSYFVKMLRLYGVDQYSDSQAVQYAEYIVDMIRDNELIRQEAEELSKEPGIDITDITDEEIKIELQSLFGFNPENENEDEFNQRLEDFLKERGISRTDLEELAIIPSILRDKVREAIGDEEYPEDSIYNHVQVRAILLGTKEDALEVKDKWDGDFNQIIKDYSPARYYPEDGYWLVMVTEGDGEGEEGELYINAMLLATKKKAEEVAAELDVDNFADLAKTYSLDSSGENGGDMGWMSLDEVESQFGDLDTIQALELNKVSDPISENYPDEAIEWLPLGIENSAIFENYAFDEVNEDSGVSEPIPDTTYSTTGGYWLVMVLGKEGEGEEEELHIQAILLDSANEAENVADKFDGDNFAELAEEYSLHSSSSGNGGDMGLLDRDTIKSRFGEDNLATIQALELNKLSEPIYDEDVSKQSGYWLIEVLDSQERTLIDEHRDIWVSDAFDTWLEEEINSEENYIVNYLDDENGYEKVLWALEHI